MDEHKLTSAEIADAERRRYGRLDVTLPVTIRYRGRLIPATALNLSCGGMMLDSESAFEESGRVEVILDLSSIERDVTLRGEVVRSESAHAGARVGIRFTNLFTIGHDAVSRYLRRNGSQ